MSTNLMLQIIYHTKPSGKSFSETEKKQHVQFQNKYYKQYLAGDWMSHLSTTVLLHPDSLGSWDRTIRKTKVKCSLHFDVQSEESVAF